jgi:hypothetical protein
MGDWAEPEGLPQRRPTLAGFMPARSSAGAAVRSGTCGGRGNRAATPCSAACTGLPGLPEAAGTPAGFRKIARVSTGDLAGQRLTLGDRAGQRLHLVPSPCGTALE